MITDLFQLGASVPGATGGVDPSLIEPQLAMVSDAVSGAGFDVYAATEDGTLRGLDFSLDLDTAALGAAAAGVESASLGLLTRALGSSARSRLSRRLPTRSRRVSPAELGGLGMIPGGGELPDDLGPAAQRSPSTPSHRGRRR